jgi:hypothetical protein
MSRIVAKRTIMRAVEAMNGKEVCDVHSAWVLTGTSPRSSIAFVGAARAVVWVARKRTVTKVSQGFVS